MPTDSDEFRLVAMLVILCAIGILTAGAVGSTLASALRFPPA
jgi:hypothetical protein